MSKLISASNLWKRGYEKRFFSSVSDAFQHISRNGFSENKFSTKMIPDSTLVKIIELTQLAPSSFNLQPYKLIVIRTDEMKLSLANAMLGPNSYKVKTAAATIVFAAHKDPTHLTRKLMALESDNNTDPTYIASLPSKISFLFGKGLLSSSVRSIGAHLLSPLVPTPKITSSSEMWAVKNTAIAAQQLMLAATSLGVSFAPMEGFDEARICFELGIPTEEFSIPLVVSLGYPEDLEYLKAKKPKLRFKMEDVCYSEKFGKSFDLHKTQNS